MSADTKIEWTDATLSPWLGCTRVSEGCAHCYIERQTPLRVLGLKLGTGQPRQRVAGFRKNAYALNRKAERDGRRIRVFPSLCDWLDAEVPVQWLVEFLQVVQLTPALDWQLLTKRPENFRPRLEAVLALLHGPCEMGTALLVVWVRNMLAGLAGVTYCAAGRENYWIGTTIENPRTAGIRLGQLCSIPAAVRFVSAEPLLGMLGLRLVRSEPCDHPGCLSHVSHPCEGCGYQAGRLPIHWVICGGESGPKARPMQPDWARSLRDQCAAAGVPFFFKQWGEWLPVDQDGGQISYAEHPRHDWPDGSQSYRVGKKAAGHLLDGREHQAMPEVPHA